MRTLQTSLLFFALLSLIGCNSGSRPSTSPELPAVQDPASTIPRSIGTDPPGGGPVVPPDPDPDAPAILDVTVSRSPLPANAWAELHAVSNVSLVSHAWHLNGGATMRSYSAYATLPIRSLLPGTYPGRVEGWDAQGQRAEREFILNVDETPSVWFGLRTATPRVAVGEEFEVDAIFEGRCPAFHWHEDTELVGQVATDAPLDRSRVRFQARHPGSVQIAATIGRRKPGSPAKTIAIDVAGVPEMYPASHGGKVLGPSGVRAGIRWTIYGEPDDYEWDLGAGASFDQEASGWLYLDLNAPGIHMGRGRAHNRDGWGEWTYFDYAVAPVPSQAGRFQGSTDQAFQVEGGKIWHAARGFGSGVSGLRLSWTAATEPFIDGVVWSTCILPLEHGTTLHDWHVDGTGQPVFVVKSSDSAWHLVTSSVANPTSPDDWVIRAIPFRLDTYSPNLIGTPERLVALTRIESAGTVEMQLSAVPVEGLSASSEPLVLEPILRVLVPWYNGSYSIHGLMNLTDGVGLVLASPDGSELLVHYSRGGAEGSYTMSGGTWSMPKQVDGQFCLLRRPPIPMSASAREFLRSGTDLPLSKTDWEVIDLPVEFSSSRPIWTVPGSSRVWIGDLGIDVSLPASAIEDRANWAVNLNGVEGFDFRPWIEWQGAQYGRRRSDSVPTNYLDVWRLPID